MTWYTATSPAPTLGYICVVSKRHVIEPFHLRGVERAAFWEETLRAAEAVDRLFRPIKINYEIHGNTIPHLHVHIFPGMKATLSSACRSTLARVRLSGLRAHLTGSARLSPS